MTSPVQEFLTLWRGFRHQCENLRDQKQQTPLEECIQIGQVLWDLSKLSSESLKPIKECLRKEALRATSGKPGCVRLDAPGARCTVTVPATQVQINPGSNIAALKELLGEDLFGDLFEEIPVSYRPRKNFRQQVSKLKEPKQIKAALEAVLVTEDLPRVSFKS